MQLSACASLLLAFLNFPLSAMAKSKAVNDFTLKSDGGWQWGAPPAKGSWWQCYPTNTNLDSKMGMVPASTAAINSSIDYLRETQWNHPVGNDGSYQVDATGQPSGSCAAVYSNAGSAGDTIPTGVRVYICGPNGPDHGTAGSQLVSALKDFLDNCAGPASIDTHPPISPVTPNMKGHTRADYTGAAGVVNVYRDDSTLWLVIQADHGDAWQFPDPTNSHHPPPTYGLGSGS